MFYSFTSKLLTKKHQSIKDTLTERFSLEERPCALPHRVFYYYNPKVPMYGVARVVQGNKATYPDLMTLPPQGASFSSSSPRWVLDTILIDLDRDDRLNTSESFTWQCSLFYHALYHHLKTFCVSQQQEVLYIYLDEDLYDDVATFYDQWPLGKQITYEGENNEMDMILGTCHFDEASYYDYMSQWHRKQALNPQPSCLKDLFLRMRPDYVHFF